MKESDTSSEAAVALASENPEPAGHRYLRTQRRPSIGCLLVVAAVLVCGCGSDSDGTAGGASPSPGSTLTYDVRLSILDSGPALGALQLDVDFLGGSGAFLGNGASVACNSLVPGALAAFNRRSTGLSVGFIDLQGIVRPSALLACRFVTRGSVDASDFEVRVTDASDTNSSRLDPLPDVRVTKVRLVE